MTSLCAVATSAHRSLTLDLMRGLACAMVLVYHLNRWVPKGLGQAAMELFFVLSGYLIAKSLVSSVERHGPRGVGRFTLRRMRRLMPGMVGFLIGALMLNLALTELSGSQFGWASFASLAGWYNFYSVHNFYEIEVIGYGGIWSLSLEEQFYVSSALFVLLLRALSKRPVVWLAVMAVLLLGVGLGFRWAAHAGVYVTESSMELSYLPWLRVWAFGLGVTVAWAERVWPRAKEPKLGARQALVALFGVLVKWWGVQTVV
jgi:peptidoglycan/LPS O-acetylase OafA/YrhL